MHISKAVITAAGRNQRTLPLQTLIDRDGAQKSVLQIIVEEVLRARIEEICVVVCPGDEVPYAQAAGEHAARLTFVPQRQPLGYGHALFLANDFVGGRPFLHLVGDHLYVSRGAQGCAEQLVEVAAAESCAVSAVQASRESLLPYYGAVSGQRVPGRQDLYAIQDVMEKPTPTEAEQRLLVPGLRAGHYLCFFGMHVLTPAVMEILGRHVALLLSDSGNAGSPPSSGATLAMALAELAGRERYLALERPWWRYDVGVKYGLLTAQIALGLSGKDRDQVLAQLLELLALRELHQA
jgi:UTP--glucose-1-phosphate uridylyltransferase